MSPAEPIRPGGPDHISARREAGEGEQTDALVHLMNAPPSLPPSPPPMHPDEAPEGSDGAGPSQTPEGHEFEDRDEAEAGSESGQTEATDDDLGAEHPRRRRCADATNHSNHGAYGRIGMARTSICQTPKIGPPLPAVTRDLRVA
eukprot:3734083-Pleurochrysis_carterae.AAC.1